ncbi:MAG: DUF3780 domain-containing protein [Geminicoccaceae bacterium]
MTGRSNGSVKVIGFGHAPEHEHHHFVVAIPRSNQSEIMIYEVFERDLVGPALIAANLRCMLDRPRWLKIVDALEEELNRRLRTAGMKAAKFKAGDNPIARLLGKELVLLAWAVEDAEPTLIPNAIQNWRGLAPEERWWLYTMTAAQTAHHSRHNLGWRKAIRFALTENPIVTATAQTTAAEYRRRGKLPNRADANQGALFSDLAEAPADSFHAGHGIWDEE